MDRIDRAIVWQLQEDGRLTNQELADRIGLSPSPCLRRVRRLEQSGVITGYSAVVDQTAAGLPVTAFVRIRLQAHTREVVAAFEQQVADIEQVQDCWLMTGDSDYLLRVVIESLAAYERFVRSRLHAIPGIAGINTSFAYGSVKRTRTYPRPSGAR